MAMGEATNSLAIAGNAGRYVSTENGPSIDSAASSAASDHVLRCWVTAAVAEGSRGNDDSPSRTSGIRRAGEGGVDRRAIQCRSEAGDEIVDVAAEQHAAPQSDSRHRRREQMRGLELYEIGIPGGVPRHLGDDAHTHSHLDVGL